MTLLSVMGLYQFDSSILDVMVLPDGVDRQTVNAQILTECAELEIMLPDPDVFKTSLKYWSQSQLPIWTKLYESTQFEYNPIWNKDGTVTETRKLDKTDTETRNLASSANTTTTGKVAGYNSNTLQTQDQATADGRGTDTGTVTDVTDHDETVTRRETGNIGVTTTQQMIREEREINQFDIYKYIVQSFKSMYCLGVY